MSNLEDQEMLELCEPDNDDLKPSEEPKDDQPVMLELCEIDNEDLKPTEMKEPIIIMPVVDTKKTEEEPKETPLVNITSEEKDTLYDSLGLDLKDPRVVTYMRLDTIHIQGVNEMSTTDVYNFFLPLKPMTLEWINDSSCNLVWPDENVAAQALSQMTVPSDDRMETKLVKKPKEPPDEKEDLKDRNQIVVVEEEEEGSEDGEISDPVSKVVWRTAANTSLKFRFATWDDRKVRGAEKYSQYYKKYGNPNFGGLKGLISGSRKRRFRDQPSEVTDDLQEEEEEEEEVKEDDDGDRELLLEDARLRITKNAADKLERKEALVKRPKMKMYADEEENRSRRPKSNNVSNRLGGITVNVSMEEGKEEEEIYDEDSQRRLVDYDDLEVSSLHEFGSRSVWDRLQVEVSNTKYYKDDDARRSHHSRNRESGDKDLRKKLQRIRDDKKKDHRSPLAVLDSTE